MQRSRYHGSSDSDAIQIKCRALQEYRHVCQRRGITLPLPQPFHKCTKDCSFYECKSIRGEMVFVCKHKLAVHLCGTYCDSREIAPNQECVVCSLTGLVLQHEQQIQHHYCRSRENPQTNKNGHFAKCLDRRGGIRKKRTVNATTKYYSFVKRAYQTLMESKERQDILTAQKMRFGADVKKIVRMNAEENNGYVDLLTTKTETILLKERYGQFLNPPAAPLPDDVFDNLINQIAAYLKKFKNVKCTYRSILSFVACLLQKLAKGMVIETASGPFTVIEKNSFFEQHVCHEISAGLLPGLSCRSMSAMNRLLQRQVMLTTELGSHVKLDYKFNLIG